MPTWNNETESNLVEVIAQDADKGTRLDQFVALSADLTRSAAARLIEEGAVTVNGKTMAKNYKISKGDAVEITLPEPEPCEALPENIPLDIIYEDADIIVINKPIGMVVHPAAGNPSGTLVNALLYHCGASLSGVGGVIRPGIVHRIDKDTSGLLVVAKNDEAHLALSAQLKEHHVSRIYTAIATGNFREEEGTVDAPIGRHPVDRKKMAVIRNSDLRSRDAVTHWSVLARGEADGNSFTLLRCQLETGRTHQIRVHMASIGHPLLGDAVYGGANTRFESRHRASIMGQCLHAGELHLTHPRTGEEMQFFAPMPANMQHVVDILFKNEEETV
ncbi:MAG: RluA family pseudouridine synthase [Ruminococcaceae bacterium]|nr:RluA family pseudouridine synthase [Oscillospiraceae bacterium]